MSIHITVLGGDMRYVRLSGLLAADGHKVLAFGMDDTPPPPPAVHTMVLADALQQAECVILPMPVIWEGGTKPTPPQHPLPVRQHPLPVATDGDTLYMPLARSSLGLTGLLECLRPNQLIAAGRVSPALREQAGRRGLTLVDFLDREELAVANAVPTAEGAIQIAMEELPITLSGSRCLIIGFGRIGKALAKGLTGLGAKVTVSARKVEDFAWITAYGYDKADTRRLDGVLEPFDAIFNTVPHPILTRDLLAQTKPGCLCIDLASKPGGIDMTAAAELGVNSVWALSLPGKVAPYTSGDILRDCLYNILEERGRLL